MDYDLTKHVKQGITLIISGIVAGFLFNIGQDLYNAGKEVIPSLPFPIIIPTVLGLIGLGIILYDLWGRRKQHKTEPEQLHKNLRIKKESPTPTQKIVTRSKKKTDDEKLLDLIQKIDLFIKKWRKSSVFKVCYKRDIEMQSMWENRGKIREHSRDISNTIKPLRSLQSPNHNVILDSLENILNRMVDLGLEVESTFETTKTIKESLKSEPNRIDRLISEGDNICRDLTNIISHLEKLR